MSRILPILVTILMIAGIGGGGYMVLLANKPKPVLADEAPVGLAVFTERVTREDLTFAVSAQGEVRPQREITVSPQVSGRISYVSPDFIEGGFVRKGQVLFRIEAADYELGVVRAQAGVASAEQTLAREQAEADVARQDLENLGITESSSLARREPQLLAAEAALSSAQAQLADAELALSRTAVISPFDGRVREESVDVGAFASPGQAVGRIFATDVVEVLLPITDAQMGQLDLPLAFAETATAKGPIVRFTANVGGTPREWTGRVVRTAASVNTATRLINVIAQLDDPFGTGADNGAPMAPGLFVSASIEGRVIEDLLVAPRGAIRSGNQIYLSDIEAGALRIFEVDLVHSSPDGAWFRSPRVSVGDLAITSPIQAAFDGMSISTLERMPDGSILTHSSAASDEAEGTAEATIANGVSQ